MIRRFVFGCFTSLIMLVLVLGVALYFIVIRPIQGLVGVVNEQPALRGTYKPPSSGKLTGAQVQRFVRVQRQTRADLGKGYTQLESRYKQLTTGGFNPSSLLDAFRETGTLLTDARSAQRRALEREKLSGAEYNWIKGEVYKAAGVDYTGLNLADLAGRFNGSGILQFFGSSYKVPQVSSSLNAPIVRPFRDELAKTSALALLGL